MDAIQFIKEHGVDKARKVIDGAPKWAMSINFNNGMYYSRMEHKKGDTFLYDIKRLVDSVDLVESLNGVETAKRCLEENMECSDFKLLKQAIADYEEIYKCTYCKGFGEVGCQFEGTFTCPDCNGHRYVGGEHV